MSRARVPILVAFLLAATAAAFGAVAGHPFIQLDDPRYLLDNPAVRQGLTAASVRWAFTTFTAFNWHPLTWLSHELDVTLFGLAPGAHHVVSLAWHGAAAATFFLVLVRSTGAVWPSLFAALVFAVHPLRVESVAWAAERKDVLAAFLGMLVLAAHLGAVRRPTAGRRALVAVLLALGLMAKPMLVTIPLVLLLLDAWPFGRLRAAADLPALLAEKVPLLVLTILSSVVTLAAQTAALVPMDVVPFPARLANAAVSAVWGVGATLWPAGLGIYYPLAPRGPGAPAIAGAALGLVLAAAAAATALRRRPFLAVGLCWYLVMLVPVSGLVQVGLQARADRYTYLPSAGLCIAGAWFAWSVAAGDRRRRLLVAGGCTAVALVWGLATARQLSFWADGEALFGHTLTVTGENLMARYGLANELAARGREAEALAQFERLAAARPDFADVRYHLGLSLQRTGDAGRAEQEYRAALSLDPGHHGAANNLGVLLFDDGRARGEPLAAAVALFRRAVALRPDWAEGRRNLARALRKAGDGAGAEREYRAALALEPGNAEARNNLGILLAERGDLRGATEQFLQVLRERPDQREARANLERAHALSGR